MLAIPRVNFEKNLNLSITQIYLMNKNPIL